jgi:predicted nucleic acid-binding protein
LILYLDASAIVKRYIHEPGSDTVVQWIENADLVGTSLISRAEGSAAFAKAARMNVLTRSEAESCLYQFRTDWSTYIRIQINEQTTTRADEFAWMLGLRGYDAMHLAAATAWQSALNTAVVMVTFDAALAKASLASGLQILPAKT